MLSSKQKKTGVKEKERDAGPVKQSLSAMAVSWTVSAQRRYTELYCLFSSGNDQNLLLWPGASSTVHQTKSTSAKYQLIWLWLLMVAKLLPCLCARQNNIRNIAVSVGGIILDCHGSRK